MPLTAVAFLVGSAAIVGLPPLNGFVSEWVVLQALLQGGLERGPIQFIVFGTAGLGLIAALAVAAFTRVFGVVFLGSPRTPELGGQEPGAGLLVPMFGLGAACLGLGVAPLIALEPAGRVVAQLLPGVPPQADGGLRSAATSVGLLAAALAALAAVAAMLRAALGMGRSPGRAPTWGCGYSRPTARMQYTASSYGAPILSAFGSLAEPPAHRTPTSFATDTADRVLSRVILPGWARVRGVAARLRPLQQGRVTTYLQYIVFTLIVLLCVLVASVGRRP
jgi:NADH:ubiquinone oxidoreductase subunit 5 (subunit L)/multisubunit Na+/H+ antiporter MnhA subunit